jgi:hypothetical protein
MLSSPHIEWLDHRSLGIYEACSAFTHVATRSLAHQPEADFVGRLQITLHAATQARRLLAFTAAGLPSPLSSMRVTLWITTAFHLDTPTKDVTSLFLRTMT